MKFNRTGVYKQSNLDTSLNKLIIIGAGGFGKEVLWLLRDLRQAHPGFPEPLGFADSQPSTPEIQGLPVLGSDSQLLRQLDPRSTGFVISIGSSSLRARIAHAWESAGFQAITCIHPSVRHSEYISLGAGSVLCAGSTLTTDIHIGRHVIINLHCTLGHDCRVEDFCTLSPGVHLSGGVHLESGCEIGTGAVLLPGVSAGKNCKLGAGAVATRSLQADLTYAGVPAKPIHKEPAA